MTAAQFSDACAASNKVTVCVPQGNLDAERPLNDENPPRYPTAKENKT